MFFCSGASRPIRSFTGECIRAWELGGGRGMKVVYGI